MVAQKRGRQVIDRDGSGLCREDGDTSDKPLETEFLEQLVWALDGLRRHAERRGGGALVEALARACDAARTELEASRPRPAAIASGRMRALWRHEGRGIV